MSHVFISYVRDDAEAAEHLARDLAAFGIDVWLDRQRLCPGERWRDAIRRAIQRGSNFIACFSSHYASRDKSYMNEELTLAIEQLRRYPTTRVWFIPVLFSECEVPDVNIGAGETLRSLQWVELYRDWDEGVKQIAAAIAPKALEETNLSECAPKLKAEDRRQIAGYLRKVAHACTEFRNALNRIRSRASKRSEPLKDWYILEEQTALVEEYLKRLSGVLKGRVRSEIIEEAAVYLGRVYVTDGSLLFHGSLYLRDHRSVEPTVLRNMVEVAGDRFPRYAIQVDNYVTTVGEGDRLPWIWSQLDSEVPSVEESLAELSSLSATIQALADAIEAGSSEV